MIITKDFDGSTITLLSNTTFTIELSECPTTGYRWTDPEYNRAVLTLNGDSFTPDSNLLVIGGGGVRRFEFTTIMPGVITSVMLYHKRSFETKPPLEVFAISIIIP